MKKFLAWFMVWGLLLACALDAQAMEQASAAPKHNVQHMQIMTKSSEGIIIADTWQDIQQKHTRIDIVEYVLADEAVKAVNQHRSVVLYQKEKMFEVSRSQGKEEEFNRDILDPYNIRNNKNRLFEATVRWYNGARWERTGTTMFNGRQVNALKRLYKTGDGLTAVNVGYVDPNTGLPIKEEYYFGESSTPTITKMYVFEEIDDPEGVLFTSAASSLLEKDAADWLCVAFDAVMPLDDALNSKMKYIACDVGDLPGLDAAAKNQVFRYFEKYKTRTLEASLEELREKGMFNPDTKVLDGPLLRVYKVRISDQKAVLYTSKYASSEGAIGVAVTLEWLGGKWQATNSALVWVS
ncbi:hypothetical protein [Brevibacillus choshinensis]|uniref:Uncharacterized protein n=1 Tax=Brevibacillus choshinensis TaxID=54911 RepID=A0ABX7FP22_BRECH|nr:hypothetical protein [Brevibacillus choshinensis]QRG67983.1 hypothetical protein JNE38_01855 [Brevibacillus choshinensis]